MRAMALLAAASLAACASHEAAPVVAAPTPYAPSAVSSHAIAGPADAEAIASGLAEMVLAQAPPGGASGPLRIEPAEGDETGMAPALVAALKRGGYLADVAASGGSHVLTYRVGSLDRGVVARATVDGTTHMARVFARSGGVLRPVGAGTVMQAAR